MSGRQSGDPSSRGSSPARPPAAAQPPLGYDPARLERKGNSRMELPADAYDLGAGKHVFAKRPPVVEERGQKKVNLAVNQYKVNSLDWEKKIYQFDVIYSTQAKKIPYDKVLQHPAIVEALKQYQPKSWIFDGRNLAWSTAQVKEIRTLVDFDAGEGKRGDSVRVGAQYHVTIRQTTTIDLGALRGYLSRKTDFNTAVEEAMNFMDHLLRHGPSQTQLPIKRNFYDRNGKGFQLGPPGQGAIEAHKGLYASLRISDNLRSGGVGLSLNADVANTAFWVGGMDVATTGCIYLATCDRKFQGLTPDTLPNVLRNLPRRDGGFDMSEALRYIRKMHRLKFKVKHANRPAHIADKVHTIKNIIFSQKYGAEGANARNHTFDCDGRQTSINDFFKQKYKVHLRFPNLPLIEDSKGSIFPMEIAFLEPMQRYNMKLNGQQTQNMLKFAVSLPAERRKDIESKVASVLRIGQDPWLRHYGVSFDTAFTKIQGKLIPEPDVHFANRKADTKGPMWRIDGLKFNEKNVVPLQSWGIIDLTGRANRSALQRFVGEFRKTFIGHGCNSPKDGVVLEVPGECKGNPSKAVEWAVRQLESKQEYPQMLFVVSSGKNDPNYEKIKRNTDCRFGILSQVVAVDHVMKCQGQYLSNVCMKVNAKLGGSTSMVKDVLKPGSKTMFIGVDISHAAPGVESSSVAAMTMSADTQGLRYSAAVENNGVRVEVMSEETTLGLFKQLAPVWSKTHNKGFPDNVLYFRDGVAEGQFAQVLDSEIKPLRAFFKQFGVSPKFTVMIATKRHHIRFFPEGAADGDKNRNSKRGTLVETDVTHPFMWDFYINSHVALKGTARPVHYHVLLDEMAWPAARLQKLIFHQCFAYARSTTAVSLHPAVYYAHLAGSRGRGHTQSPASEGHKHGGKGHELARDRVAKGQHAMRSSDLDVSGEKMIPVGGEHDSKIFEGRPMTDMELKIRAFIKGTMWFI